MILSSTHPVWVNDKVMGAVVVEETTNAIVTLRNQALVKLFNVTLAVFLIGALTLFIFASRISIRIRRLRNEAEHAIDPQGRVKGLISGSMEKDEIGDLSRSFSTIIGKLGQYTDYLENMGSRLSHEMRTPIAVVRSSLDNLKLQNLPDEAKIYMERAHEGLARLSMILTRMSEATRLEQTLQHAEHENFNVSQVLSGCIEGYRLAYPANQFVLELAEKNIWLSGSPDLFTQMLDKLVTNAIEFSDKQNPILIRLNLESDHAILEILNKGPLLPKEMKGQLFESMVSVRPHKTDNEPHLGLGLYIARLIAEFHHGKINAANTEHADGVVISIQFLLM
jgi:dedicated sortase system histidine kinase